MESTVEQIGIEVGKEFLPLYNELTTSDLQGCITAAVGKRLTGTAASQAEEVALNYIYEQQK